MEDKRKLLTFAELLEIHPKFPCRTFNPALYHVALEEILPTSGFPIWFFIFS